MHRSREIDSSLPSISKSQEEFRNRVTQGVEDVVEEELEEAGIVPAPDGGWGWVVVAGSFLANVIVDGIIFTAGSGFQPEWEDYFKTSSSATAWVVSLLSGCYLLAGPVTSALANFFGCKLVAMAGTILASAGFILSQFATQLPLLYLTFGIMGGIGFGLIYLPSIVIVSYYFKSKRAFATGLAVCGSGIGTFAFAPLIKFLLDNFTWQQSLLIISGISLNALVCGSVYRSLKPTKKQVQQVADIARKYRESHTVVEEQIANGKVIVPQMSHLSEVEVIEENPKSPHVAQGVAIERFPRRRIRTQSPTSERPFMSVMELRARQRHSSMFSIPEKNLPATSHSDLYRIISQESVAQLNRPLSRMDIFYPGSMSSLQRRTSGVITPHHSVIDVHVTAPQTWSENIVDVLKQILDFSLLKSPSFLILALGGFLTFCGFFVPFIYLPRVSLTLGHSKEQSMFLISILGITNIVARVVCGYMSDNPKLDALIIHNVAVSIAGIATAFVPFYSSYWVLCSYCIVFGFGTACFASLRSIICVELLGLERLTSAFGFLMLFMGIAAMVGSPIAGALYDASGSYDLSFYVTGTLITLSGLIGFPLKTINRWENRSFHDSEVELSGISGYEYEDGKFSEENNVLRGSISLKPIKRIPTVVPEVSEEEEQNSEPNQMNRQMTQNEMSSDDENALASVDFHVCDTHNPQDHLNNL